MSVVPFPYRNSILIDFGRVSESSDPTQIGRSLFFVSWADENGGEVVLYDSADYVMAAHEAKEAKRDFDAVAVVERFRLNGGAS